MLSFTGDIDSSAGEKMKAGYSDCKIDEYSIVSGGRVLMGCAKQFLIEGMERDVIPYEDDTCIFTVSGMIDGKDRVAAELGLDPGTPDGAVLLNALKKWKFEFGEHLFGAFSACYYDKKERKMYLFTDHTACRCVYWYKTKDAFYFSTLVKPILNMEGDKIGFRERLQQR